MAIVSWLNDEQYFDHLYNGYLPAFRTWHLGCQNGYNRSNSRQLLLWLPHSCCSESLIKPFSIFRNSSATSHRALLCCLKLFGCGSQNCTIWTEHAEIVDFKEIDFLTSGSFNFAALATVLTLIAFYATWW